MLLTLDINRLNPHQVTSVLGLIVQNDLALITTVKYRMNSLTTIVPYPWKVAVCIASENSQCKFFYYNGGGYVHQSNNTVREFYLNLSDSKLQNVAKTTVHLYTLLENVFQKKQMIRGRTMWDQTDGCAKQYRCSIAYYIMSYLSKSYQIVLDRAVDTPGCGKYVADGFHAVQKRYLATCLIIDLPLN